MFTLSALLHLLAFVSPLGTGAVSTEPRDSRICTRHSGLSRNTNSNGTRYMIGVGKADITGPVAELALAGYGKFEQIGSGLRQRLFCRAFIVADADRPEERVAYLVLDNLAGDTAVKYGLIESLAAAGDEYAVYQQHNIALTATHTHSGPGGWFNYLLPQAPTFGLHDQSYRAVVDGAALSIKRAHDGLEEGFLDVAITELHDASINRSPFAYLKNPAEERAKYSSDVDKRMTVLRFQRARDGRNIGLLNWFAVHGTSIHNNNTHIAGDNKGVAAWMLEKSMSDDDSAAPGFVAGFSQANEGDVSPNILGPWCDDGSNVACTFDRSTCADGTTKHCHARGPEHGADRFGLQSCYEIGRRQYVGAKAALDSMDTGATPIRGRVKSFHFFHDMANWSFTTLNGTSAMTCPPAFGYSAVAGCTDGEGMPGFWQGIVTQLPRNLWTFFFTSLRRPSSQQVACHYPKPILFDATFSWPYAWGANIVDVQMLRIGQLLVATSPSEVTTMSGRRWTEAIKKYSASIVGNDTAMAIVAGPANTYAHYVTTAEEYAAQRYEGGSTMFGPNQLAAYINLTVSNLHHLGDAAPLRPQSDTRAPDNRPVSLSLFPRVLFDRTPFGRNYGQALTPPRPLYNRGDRIVVTFQGANPRNDLRLEKTYAAVERFTSGLGWTQVRSDDDWSLVFTWRRTNFMLGYSEVDITWETERDVESGIYRLRYYGDAKKLMGNVHSFQGSSSSFRVV